jgi:hypothetical protein
VSRPALRPTHPVSYPVSARGPFPEVRRSRSVTLTTQPHLVSRSRMSRSCIRSSPWHLHGGSGSAFLSFMKKFCWRWQLSGMLRRVVSSVIALMMEAVRTSETSVYFSETTRRLFPESWHLHTRRRKNLLSHTEAGLLFWLFKSASAFLGSLWSWLGSLRLGLCNR